MKNLKTIFGWLTLVTIITFGTTLTNAGIVVAGLTDDPAPTPCTEKEGIVVAGLTGIVVAGFGGIVVAGLTGIVVAGITDDSEVCGIVVAG